VNRVILFLGGIVFGGLVVWFGPYLLATVATGGGPSLISRQSSICSDDRVKRTVAELASQKLGGHPAPNWLYYEVRQDVSNRTARFELTAVRNLGTIEGNGGSRCAAQVEIYVPGATRAADTVNTDYSVEFTEDQQRMVRARFSASR
jgi:hypothetical protein